MAQAKKKTATRTRKAAPQRKAGSRANTRTAKKQQITRSEKMHIYIVTAMAMIAGILLCANAAMMVI